jgi:RNA polymerase sigma factor (sigma-70 family)
LSEEKKDPSENEDQPESQTLGLIRRAKQGEREAVDDLFANHYERLKLVVRSQLGPGMRANLEDTQDILHSAFRGALKSLPDYEPEGEDAWVRWMGTIIANKIASRARYHGAQKRGGGAHPVGGTEGLGLIGDVHAEQESPATKAEALEGQDLIYEALEQLSQDHRQILIMTHISKRPLSEVAEVLKCSADSARHRIKRAENALGAVLKKMRPGHA